MKMKSKIKSSLALYLLTLRVHSQWLCCCWQSLFAACVLLLLLIVGWYFVAEISSWDIVLYFTGDTDTINYREPEWRVVSCPAQSCLMLPNRRMTAQPESHSSSHCSLYDLETIYSVHIGQKDHFNKFYCAMGYLYKYLVILDLYQSKFWLVSYIYQITC